MDSVLNELSYDFNAQIYMFNNYVKHLKSHEQPLALAWVNKLRRVSATVEEAQIRNDFLYYLVKNCLHGELKTPFRDEPPKGPLINIKNLLPKQPGLKSTACKNKKRTKKCELFDKSPDKGVFLAAQPVPRCGAFCYLAVISKPPPEV